MLEERRTWPRKFWATSTSMRWRAGGAGAAARIRLTPFLAGLFAASIPTRRFCEPPSRRAAEPPIGAATLFDDAMRSPLLKRYGEWVPRVKGI
jgi:hypothetical protein